MNITERVGTIFGTVKLQRASLLRVSYFKGMEAAIGIEPMNKGFAARLLLRNCKKACLIKLIFTGGHYYNIISLMLFGHGE
jgi:hypothetical protein